MFYSFFSRIIDFKPSQEFDGVMVYNKREGRVVVLNVRKFQHFKFKSIWQRIILATVSIFFFCRHFRFQKKFNQANCQKKVF